MSGSLHTVVAIVPADAGGSLGDGLTIRIRERIEPYGGRPGPAPGIVHFDSPTDALRFAAAVRDGAGDHRTGIDAGPDGDLPSQVAAALASYARPGEILLTEVVHRLAGSLPGTHHVDRGRVRPPTLDRRLQLHALADGGDGVPLSPLVGRDTEREAVEHALESMRAGSGAAIVIEGEAGIGKTHLVRAVADAARSDGVLVVRGVADELGIETDGLLTTLADSLGVVRRRDHDAGDDPAFAHIESIVDGLHRVAARGPVLVVAEDLHWADETSLRMLTAIARAIGPLPACLLATMRPTPRPAGLERCLAAVSELSGTAITLAPLDEHGVNDLATARFGAVPGERLRQAIRRAGGNPLHVTELLRSLEDDGMLRVDRGVVELDATPAELTRPAPADHAGLDQTVRRRLDTLPRDAIEALRLASLIGTAFTLNELAIVAARPVVELAKALGPALDAGIVDGSGERLAFHHDLIHGAVYEAIPTAVRRDLHLAAGRALAAAGAPARTVAGHVAIGARPGDEAAVEWLVRAAREARQLDSDAAIDHYRRARALLVEDDHRRASIDAELVEVLGASGHVEATVEVADDLLLHAVEPAHEVAARRARASALVSAGDLAAAAAECRSAAEIAPTPEDVGALHAAAAAMDVIVGGDVAAAEAVAAPHARTDGPAACWAEQTLGIAALAQARYGDAHDHLRRSRTMLDRRYIPTMGFLLPHSWEAGALGQLDRFDEARRASHRARRRAERRGETPLLVQAGVVLAMIAYLTGEWDDAMAELAALDGIAEATGAEPQRIFGHGLRAAIAHDRGDAHLADAELDRGRAVLEAGSQHLFGVEILLSVTARRHLERSEVDEARGLLEMLWAQVQPIAFLLQFGMFVPQLVALRHSGGDAAGAAELAGAIERADSGELLSHRATAMRCRALAEDDPDLLGAAVASVDESPRIVARLATLEDAARLYAVHGRAHEASVAVERAVALAEPMGADGWVARLRQIISADAPSRPTRPTHGWAALSPKEHEVVSLVAEGLSNPEIAERLFISRRTVESHLSHVFRKLDLSNRTQLARAVLERAD